MAGVGLVISGWQDRGSILEWLLQLISQIIPSLSERQSSIHSYHRYNPTGWSIHCTALFPLIPSRDPICLCIYAELKVVIMWVEKGEKARIKTNNLALPYPPF